MGVRYFAIVFGIVYTLVGVLGFFPAFLTPIAEPGNGMAIDTLYGNLLGIFPVNILHTLVHLVLGIWGIAAYRAYASSRVYARSLAVIFGVLAVFGLIPGLNTLFGLVPLFGTDVFLHAATAIIAAYFGWASHDAVDARDSADSYTMTRR